VPTWLGIFAIATFCVTVALGYAFHWSTGDYLVAWAVWFGVVIILAVLVERSKKRQ
jgi:hypothetical protein